MKKLILVSIASLILSSTYANAEWVKPTKSVCTLNGGQLNNGICKANWQTAKDICQASGARLPTKDELTSVITSCGGVVDNYDNNKNNLDYQSCYQRRGFSNKNSYWSSTSLSGRTTNTWIVDFYYGYGRGNLEDYSYSILCVR